MRFVVWFDAHGDLNTPESTTYLGGLAISAACVRGRDLGRPVTVWWAVRWAGEISTRDRPVYFHLDCDVLEPGLVPTDYRVPNGLSLDELSGVARRLAENAVVGVEVAEFEGSWSDTGAPGDPGPLLTALSPLVGG